MNRNNARTQKGPGKAISGFRFPLMLLGLCAVVSLWLAYPISAGAATVDLPTYVQRLTTARDAINQARRGAGVTRDANIRRATDALDGIDAVTVDGTTYAPQLDSARGSLHATPLDLDRALTLVNTLRDSAVTVASAAPDANAHAKLDEVLRDRDFHADQPNVIQRQFMRFTAWLGEQWRRLTAPLRRINPPNPSTPAPEHVPGASGIAALLAALGSWQALIIYAVILAALAAFFVWRRQHRRGKRDVDTRAVPERTALGWREYAATLAADGNYRGAVHAVLLGVLRDLDERNVVPFDPARTDREYLRAVSERGDWLATTFRPLVRLVEGVFYASAPCGQAEYEQARTQAEAMHAAATEAQAFAGAPV